MKEKITRIFQIEQFIRKYNSDCVLAGKENGVWRKYSADEFIEYTDAVAYGLINLGVKKGDRVSIISVNRPEWMLVDMGIAKMTGVNNPIYANITTEDYDYILKDSGAKIVFVGSKEIYDKVKDVAKENPNIQAIYSFDKIEGVPHWLELVELGKSNPQSSQVKAWQVETSKDELFTLIYTSGTTGNPKGVMLSHSNILCQLDALEYAFPFGRNDRSLSFLPLCHSFQRVLEYYTLKRGTDIYYAESIDTLADNMKEVSPTLMATVPRLLEKVYDKIYAKGTELSGIKKVLFFWALELGLKHEYEGANGAWYNFQLKIANKLIFSKWREAFGGEMKYVISGAAALQTRLCKVFNAAQIPIYEGYGLSETSPVISANTPKLGEHCYGTVGPVIRDVEVKIAEDGEILCKGPNVMLGYYNLEEKTNEMIQDGWLATGDIGEIVDGKFLKITDRKKEIFKTSGGKYIAPQVLENKFKESKFIEQIMVVGEGEKFPGALIVLSFETMREWCSRHDITYTTDAEMSRDERIISRIEKELGEYNKQFANYQQIKRFELVPNNWTIDGGELTATLKMKRRIIVKKYKDLLDKIYTG
jgi:long-chain acyl-CoA synthetase